MRYTVAVTGHRPNKLFGYDLNDDRYVAIKNIMKGYLIGVGCTDAYSGMALGIDQLFAIAVLQLKNEGYPIKLHCAIPCANHSSAWPESSQVLYKKILSKADTVEMVSNEPYAPWLMQKRNEYMVDRADEILAFHDGTKGGTKNCVDYAKKVGRKITIIDPRRVV